MLLFLNSVNVSDILAIGSRISHVIIFHYSRRFIFESKCFVFTPTSQSPNKWTSHEFGKLGATCFPLFTLIRDDWIKWPVLIQMKSNDTLRFQRRWTVMKTEPARREPSCGTTEASVDISGFQHGPWQTGNLLGKLISWSGRVWQMQQ